MSVLLVFGGACLGYLLGTTNIVEHPWPYVLVISGVVGLLLVNWWLMRRAR
jgi:hypothetical protein